MRNQKTVDIKIDKNNYEVSILNWDRYNWQIHRADWEVIFETFEQLRIVLTGLDHKSAAKLAKDQGAMPGAIKLNSAAQSGESFAITTDSEKIGIGSG